MNTRLQVEHPVTELAYGVDLVELQVRIAAGDALPWSQEELQPRQHAIEARVYAEDPSRGFLPSGGTIRLLREPSGPHVRVDSGLLELGDVGSDYDPMLAKVIAFGADRSEALRHLDRALAQTVVLGVTTNIGFLRDLLGNEAVRAGDLDTGLVERILGDLVDPSVPDHVVTAATVAAARPQHGGDPWSELLGWRHGQPGWIEHEWLDEHRVRVEGRTYHVATHGPTTWVGFEGRAWAISPDTAAEVGAAGGDVGGVVRSPMPGLVIDVRVGEGDRVEAGQPVAVVEAMKMEHTLTSSGAGVVVHVHAAIGDTVALDQPIVTIEPISTEEPA
jgi:acetyl-CoA/propionyl-CoA carboxylase biotin carboxyl carrier protein